MAVDNAGPSQSSGDIEIVAPAERSQALGPSDSSLCEIPESGMTIHVELFRSLSLNMKRVWMSLRQLWDVMREHRADFLTHKTEVNQKLDLILEALGHPTSRLAMVTQDVQEVPTHQSNVGGQVVQRVENLRALNDLDIADVWREWTVGVPTGGGTRDASLRDLEASKTMEAYRDFGDRRLKTAVMRRRHIAEHIEKRVAELKAAGLVEDEAQTSAINEAEQMRYSFGKGGKKCSLYCFWKHIRGYK